MPDVSSLPCFVDGNSAYRREEEVLTICREKLVTMPWEDLLTVKGEEVLTSSG